MMKHFMAGLLAVGAVIAAGSASAATVSVVSGTRGATILGGGPIGQSFTATDSLLTSFGFQFATSVRTATSADVTFSLLQGADLSGPVLATSTVTINGLSFRTGTTFFDVFNSSIPLVSGQTYTAQLTTTSSNLSLLFGPSVGQSTDAYAGGALIKNNAVDQVCLTGVCDANFRFTTTSAAVSAAPEPATWLMMIAGFGIAGAGLRYRRKALAFQAA